MKNQFLLDPELTYLNHGGFGGCPKPIFEDYQKWQLELERSPVQFITKTGETQLKISKQALGSFINCDWDDLIYVTNPTTAFNTVIKSLALNKGEEILTTNHEYGALDKTWKYYCAKNGAKYVQQNITLPIQSKEEVLKQFWAGLTPKTKYIFLSQISSSTALIFPAKEICDKAKELGLITIIDGAHVPNHIPLDLKELKADFYTGACHKWMLTPKGSSFLYVSKAFQKQIDPLVISWGYDAEIPSDSQLQDYHQYQGTRDFSAFLTIPKAIQFYKDNDWETKKKECRSLLKHYSPIVAKELKTQLISPVTDEFLGQICSIPIKTSDNIALHDILYAQYKIEIPVFKLNNSSYIRVSFQAYNGAKEIEYLLDAIKDIKATTNLIY
jgi:isopenicillin-N epimerase